MESRIFHELTSSQIAQPRFTGLIMFEERVVGGFEVETHLVLGTEHLLLFFTQKRLILAHLAKLGRGNTGLSRLLGGLSTGFGKSTRKGELLERMAGYPPDAILALDKDNFGISYDHVVSLTVEPGGYERADLTIVTGDMKLELSASLAAVQGLGQILESRLGSKAEFRL